MEIFELYDVLEAYMVSEWREQIEKEDKRGFIKQSGEEKYVLKAQLNDEQKKLLDGYSLNLENAYEDTFYEICKNLFYFAFKAGMDFQKALI